MYIDANANKSGNAEDKKNSPWGPKKLSTINTGLTKAFLMFLEKRF